MSEHPWSPPPTSLVVAWGLTSAHMDTATFPPFGVIFSSQSAEQWQGKPTGDEGFPTPRED